MIDFLQRRRELLMMGGDNVPYQKVEWLSSDGRAFINTGIVPKDTPRVVINVCLTQYTDSDIFGFSLNIVPSFIGDIDGSNNTTGNIRFQYYRYYTTTARAVRASGVPYNQFSEWDLGYEVICNGTTLATFNRESFSANTQTLYLFRGRNVASRYARIGNVQIYDGDTLMRDFVPVRVGTTGYMYDKVSGQLFGNAGTGDFILGNDI